LFASHIVMVVFTIVFAATGLYSLVRFATLAAGTAGDGDRVAELLHLLMSIAMIAMTWACTGGPDTASGLLQIVVFGLIGVWFLLHIAEPGSRHGRRVIGYHIVMAAAMVWMVAAMPVLMGGSGASMTMSAGGGTHGDHSSMAGMDGMDGMAGMSGAHGPGATAGTGGMTGPPVWALVVTVAFVALLVGAMALWSSRLIRPATPHAFRTEALPTGPAGDAATAVVARSAPPGVAILTEPRLNAGCHLLMSLGMAAALLAML
jgi:Domain of unknown function (DUF5134)